MPDHARAGFTLTWHDPDEAENVAEVLIEAGTRGGKVIDRGFYEDGKNLMEQVDVWRAKQREADDPPAPAETQVEDLMEKLYQSVKAAREARDAQQ